MIGIHTHGRGHLCWVTKQSIYRPQKPACFLIQYFVLAKCTNSQRPKTHGERKIEWFTVSPQYREFDRIDGEPMQFEWFTTFRFSLKLRRWWAECDVNLSSSQVESSSLQWDCMVKQRKHNTEVCVANSMKVAQDAKRFPHGHWSFLGPGSEKKWCGSKTYKPSGEWNDVAEQMILNFSEKTDIPNRGTSPLERLTLRSTRGGKLSIHFCGDPETFEVVFRTITSVN